MDTNQNQPLTGIKANDHPTWKNFLPEARAMAAQCWCDTQNSGTQMDEKLAESIAQRIAVWMDEAAQAHRNAQYYRGIVLKCGRYIGAPAYTADDGSIMDDVLVAKVPELVYQMCMERRV